MTGRTIDHDPITSEIIDRLLRLRCLPLVWKGYIHCFLTTPIPNGESEGEILEADRGLYLTQCLSHLERVIEPLAQPVSSPFPQFASLCESLLRAKDFHQICDQLGVPRDDSIGQGNIPWLGWASEFSQSLFDRDEWGSVVAKIVYCTASALALPVVQGDQGTTEYRLDALLRACNGLLHIGQFETIIELAEGFCSLGSDRITSLPLLAAELESNWLLSASPMLAAQLLLVLGQAYCGNGRMDEAIGVLEAELGIDTDEQSEDELVDALDAPPYWLKAASQSAVIGLLLQWLGDDEAREGRYAKLVRSVFKSEQMAARLRRNMAFNVSDTRHNTPMQVYLGLMDVTNDKRAMVRQLQRSPLRFLPEWQQVMCIHILSRDLASSSEYGRSVGITLLESYLGIEYDDDDQSNLLRRPCPLSIYGSLSRRGSIELIGVLIQSLTAPRFFYSLRRAYYLGYAALGVQPADAGGREHLVDFLLQSVSKVDACRFAVKLARVERSLGAPCPGSLLQQLDEAGVLASIVLAGESEEDPPLETFLVCFHELVACLSDDNYCEEWLNLSSGKTTWADPMVRAAITDHRAVHRNWALERMQTVYGFSETEIYAGRCLDWLLHPQAEINADVRLVCLNSLLDVLIDNKYRTVADSVVRRLLSANPDATYKDMVEVVGQNVVGESKSPLLKGVKPINCIALLHRILDIIPRDDDSFAAVGDLCVKCVENLYTAPTRTVEYVEESVERLSGIVGELLDWAVAYGDLMRKRGLLDKAQAVQEKSLWWRNVLRNRILLERVRRVGEPINGNGTQAITQWMPYNWPLQAPWSQSAARCWRSRFAQQTATEDGGQRQFIAACLDVVPGSESVEIREARIEPTFLRKLPGQPYELHELIPRGSVLISIVFASDGVLHWSAWLGGQTSVQLLASGTSAPEAHRRLRHANDTFLEMVDFVWHSFREVRAGGQVGWFVDAGLFELISRYARYPQLRAMELSTEESRSQLRLAVEEELRALSEKTWGSAPSGLSDLSALGMIVAELIIASVDEQEVAHPALIKLWDAAVECLTVKWDEENAERLRRSLLDRLTAAQCALLSDEMDLSPLEQVDREWADTDVLLQVSSPLHTMPVSFVRFGDARLFERVASTTHVISLPLLKHQIEHAGEKVQPGRDILAALWEHPTRRSGSYGLPLFLAELHEICEHQQKLPRQAWSVWALGDAPPASRTGLVGALSAEDKRFGVVVVAGHGTTNAGIELADGEPWLGEGVDLSEADVTILQACSIGQIRESLSKDIDGFYVKLLLSQCRTAISARWKIADIEASALTASMLEEYMRAYDDNGVVRLFDRARSLNVARRNILEKGRASEHLVSAFELYGTP